MAAFDLAKQDPDYASALEQVKAGRYENLQPDEQTELLEGLRTPSAHMGKAVEEAGLLLDRVEQRVMERDERYSHQFYSGFEFDEVKVGDVQTALERLHLGASTGIEKLDTAIDGYGAVRRASDPMEVGLISHADQIALGRMLSDYEKMDHLEADEFLTRALVDRDIMEQAEMDILRGIGRDGIEAEAEGRYDLLSEIDTMRISSAFAYNSRVSPIDQIRAQGYIVVGEEGRDIGLSADLNLMAAHEAQMAVGY